ncbi:hypothetical protein HKCCE3408_19435, partial [Rhodobacterales bacterium HKCCE3408]|nr:hypothetical protein [Rhodobacterales bacterium HKCCE3408]
MTVDFALFLSPEGIALAHRQPAGHWALIGETGLEGTHLARRLGYLRMLGEARGGEDFPTLLILPDDQILYAPLDIMDGPGTDLRLEVGRALDGRTPYALGELAFDFRRTGPGQAQVAAVAQETLTEALDFARAAGFNGAGFAATPPASRFPGVPVFEMLPGYSLPPMDDDGLAFGRDDWTETDALSAEPPEPEPAGIFVTEAAHPTAPVVEVAETEVERVSEEAAEAEAAAAAEEDAVPEEEQDDGAAPEETPAEETGEDLVPDAPAEDAEPVDGFVAEAEDLPEATVSASEDELPAAAETPDHVTPAAADTSDDPETGAEAPEDEAAATMADEADAEVAGADEPVEVEEDAPAEEESAAELEETAAEEETAVGPDEPAEADDAEPVEPESVAETEPDDAAADEDAAPEAGPAEIEHTPDDGPAPDTEPAPTETDAEPVPEIAAREESGPQPARIPAVEAADHDAAAFAVEADKSLPVLRFGAHRTLTAASGTVGQMVRARPSRLGLVARRDPEPEPKPQAEAAPETQPEAPPKRRMPRLPAVLAGRRDP